MKRCILCGRKMSQSNHSFGLGCLKELAKELNLTGVKI